MKNLQIFNEGETYRVSQEYGLNPQIYNQFGMDGHNGIDYACPEGTELYACIDGDLIVLDTGDRGYGLHIKIRNDEYEVVYGHLRTTHGVSRKGVKAGDLIGFTGNTGFSTGPHLHFGIRERKDGQVINYDNGYYGYVNPEVIDQRFNQFNPIIMKAPSKKAELLMENVDDMPWIKQETGDCVPFSIMTAAILHAKGNYPELDLKPDPYFDERLRTWLGRDPYSEMGIDATYIDQKLDDLQDEYIDIFCGDATLRLYGKDIIRIKEKEGINRDIVEIIKESYIDNGMPVIVGMTWTHWDYKVERIIPEQTRQNNPTAVLKHEATIVGMDNEYAYWYDNKYPKHSPGLPDGVNRMELDFLRTKGNLATNGLRGFLAIKPEVIINK